MEQKISNKRILADLNYEGENIMIGGSVEDDETTLQAAIRECLEETGIKIENPRLLVTYIYPENNPVNSGTI